MCLDDVRRVNVIIGKNNTGKSSVLDVVGACFDKNRSISLLPHVGSLYIGMPLSEDHITKHFAHVRSIGNIYNVQQYTKSFVGSEYCIDFVLQSLSSGTMQLQYQMSKQSNQAFFQNQGAKIYWEKIANDITRSQGSWVFRNLSADRNIVPEAEDDEDFLGGDGSGASNLIRKFLNNSKYDEDVIQETLLNALNRIMFPEAEFENIKVQQIETGDNLVWEVFLQEKGSKRFALSQSGSGLKTIILILLNLLAIPKIAAYKGKQFHYGFEEIENNLHPALQRRVFEYIYDYAIKNDIYIFLTTHSHVAINSFFDKEEAQIYHVTKEGNASSIRKIETHLDKVCILDDLNVKASDLLQSNGIIWVEGPSDRVYIKCWLEVFCADEYEEGQDYQFMYYGGKLLSHYSAKEAENLINILTTNRNSAIVIDSDKKNQQASINSTKKRIVSEFEASHLFAWVTKGKEIENYIPVSAINEALGLSLKKQCKQYEPFPEYIMKGFSNFAGQKVKFAQEVRDAITMDNSKDMLDLSAQIKRLSAQIANWNK